MQQDNNINKIKYSNFHSIQEVMNSLDFNYKPDETHKKETFFSEWKNIVGEKLAKVSKPFDITDKKILIISCMNSYIANELFLLKKDILTVIQDKLDELNLQVKDIIFDYKNWKR